MLWKYCVGVLEESDPSSSNFVVPVTGSAGQRTSRRKALPIKLKHIPSSNHFVVPVTGSAGQRTSRRKALPILLKNQAQLVFQD